MRESRLKWFGHWQQTLIIVVVRSEMMQAEGVKRTRGQSKLAWVAIERKDMGACDLMTDTALDRVSW